MSSPLGPIDINRILLNRKANQQYQNEQQQIQAQRAADEERQRQIQAQKQKQAEEDARIQRANMAARNDPLAIRGMQEARAKDAGTFNTNFVPKPVVTVPKPTIDYAAETKQDFAIFKQADASGKLAGPVTVTRNYGNPQTQQVDSSGHLVPLTGSYSYNVSYTPTPPPAPDMRPGTPDYYKNQFANSRSAQQIGVDQENIARSYAAFKANEIIKGFNQSTGSGFGLSQSDINALARGGVNNGQEIANLVGQTPQKASISTEKTTSSPGGPVEQRYYVPDPTNPFITKSESEYFKDNFDVNPTMPFMIEPKASQGKSNGPNYQAPKPSGDLANDFLQGYGNVFVNLGKMGYNLGGKLTGQPNVPYAPEVEGSFYTSVIGAGSRATKGQSATDNVSQILKDLTGIGKGIAENPLYAAGSLAGSAAAFIATAGIGPAAKAGTNAARFGLGALKAEKVATTAAKEFGISEEVTTQAFKITKGGIEEPLQKTGPIFLQNKQILNIPYMLETSVTKISKIPGVNAFSEQLKVTGIGTKGISVKVPAIPDFFKISKVMPDTIEDIGAFSTKTGKGGIFQNELSQSEKGLQVGQKITPAATKGGLPTVEELIGARAPASAITDVFQNEAKVLPKITPPFAGESVPDIGGQLVKSSQGIKMAESQPLGYSISEFSTKKMLDFANYSEKSALSQAEKDALGIGKTTSANKPARPFDFGTASQPLVTKGSRSALETIGEFDFDRVLQNYAKTLLPKASGPSRALSAESLLGATAAKGASLGLGDSRLAVRSRSRENVETSFESLVTPNVDSIAKQFMGTFGKTGTKVKTESDLSTFERSLTGFNTKPRETTKEVTSLFSLDKTISNLISTPKQGNRTTSTTLTGLGIKLDTTPFIISEPKVNTGTRQIVDTTLEIPKITIPVPKTPKTPPELRFDFGFEQPKKRRGKKRKGVSVYGKSYGVRDPLSAVFGGKMGRELQKIADSFG